MAEALARNLAANTGLASVEVRSAGTSTTAGLPASEGALGTARLHGLDLESHRSSPLSQELVGWADRILTMSAAHLYRVRELGGGEKGDLLVAFALGLDGEGDDLGVPDPFGGDDAVYEETFKILREHVENAMVRIGREREE